MSLKKVRSSQLYTCPTNTGTRVAPQFAQANPVIATKSETEKADVPPSMKEEIVFVTDTMGNKLWDFDKNNFQTKIIHVPVSSYDVAGVHLQSTSDPLSAVDKHLYSLDL